MRRVPSPSPGNQAQPYTPMHDLEIKYLTPMISHSGDKGKRYILGRIYNTPQYKLSLIQNGH